MYNRILLTLDGSDEARRAIPHAVALSGITGAPVVVLTVVDSEAHVMMQAAGGTLEPVAAGPVAAEIAHDAVTAQRAVANETLAAAKRDLEAQSVRDVSVEIREGSAGDAIVETAEALGCDVVVMATHGRSGFKRAILGSVAEHVVRNVDRAAVLLVRVAD